MRNPLHIAIWILLGSILVTPNTSRADFIVNGNFGTFATSGTGIFNNSSQGFYTYDAGAVGIQGWTVLDTSIDVYGQFTGTWQSPPGGTYGLDLMGTNGNNTGSTVPQYGGVSQTVTGLTPGQTYQLSFQHSVNSSADPNAQNPVGGLPDYEKSRTLDIAILDASDNPVSGLSPTGTGTVVADGHVQYTLLTGTRTPNNMEWLGDAVTFAAPTSSLTIQFSTAQFSDPTLSLDRSGPALGVVSLIAVPEPASLGIIALASSLLLMRRRRVSL